MSVRAILVTGAAGFIGFHLVRRLLDRGDTVVGLDNMNDYYNPQLKRDRLIQLEGAPAFSFRQVDLADGRAVADLFAAEPFQCVVNLAAQAGVRHSVQHPESYVSSNLVGFSHVLEGCRHARVEHLVYASSSSVYGGRAKMPFSVEEKTDYPISLYAATKKANELMAHAYSHLYGLPATGLRFFTVYGPWGRPDMAIYSFADAIVAGRPIDVYNYGDLRRDFTYIDDIVEGVVRVMERPPAPHPRDGDSAMPAAAPAPHRVYNIGNNRPVEVVRLIHLLESELGRTAVINLCPMQAGDVPETWADVDDLIRDVGFKPDTSIELGVARFVEWYRRYHRV